MYCPWPWQPAVALALASCCADCYLRQGDEGTKKCTFWFQNLFFEVISQSFCMVFSEKSENTLKLLKNLVYKSKKHCFPRKKHYD